MIGYAYYVFKQTELSYNQASVLRDIYDKLANAPESVVPFDIAAQTTYTKLTADTV